MSFDNPAVDPPLLEVRGLSKVYRIFDRPGDRLKQILFGGFKRYYRDYTALEDISFSIAKGETVGIVGRNGAGKSTLLQILTGTLQETAGEVVVNGRVAALLELGSGINPELTGRENVRLLAAILGLDDAETRDRMPAILAFAELGEFIDQPVKSYSSGMYVRLAFSIATCVDPDLLIVDEALSVGDVAFRNKCMRRINELRAKNVSILFVSHDLSTLQMICDRAIWLNDGRVKAIGNPVQITQDFHAFMLGGDAPSVEATESRPLTPTGRSVPQQITEHGEFTVFRLRRHGGGAEFSPGDDIAFEFALKAAENIDGIIFGLSVYRRDGDWIIGQTNKESKVSWPPIRENETAKGIVILKSTVLGPGEYIAAIAAYSNDLSLLYAMTELNVYFSIRTAYPTWGRLIHPIVWEPHG
ncbi:MULTISPECIES: ABC transporter ATP-binding protein [Hyphomicrobiales]|jgi:ABC-type polysaccharide/polyol phosphate transport system ATPase subunit|uniref:ABC transporter ATP-binding protein n=1 Tax=Methylobacterium sp. CCH7-A2 TaxID=1768789 RepID=UPI00082AB9CE|nr:MULTISPECIES: ABC transporter ATP-binding protein [Hyphomicrobiales]